MSLLLWTSVLALALPAVDAGDGDKVSGPWWEKEKIRFFWGQWQHMDEAGVTIDQTMKNLVRVGATVFASGYHSGGDRQKTLEGAIFYHLATAEAAHKHGIRYFATGYVTLIDNGPDGIKPRPSVNRDGQPYVGTHEPMVLPCPLDGPYYEHWFLDPTLKLAKTGLVDGLHLDWERYAGRGEAGICYCDECFATFLKQQGKRALLPEPMNRYEWLEEGNLSRAYLKTYRIRRIAMFREFEKRVHEAHPTFVFSGYYMRPNPDVALGLHSPEVPFFVVDDRHYYEGHPRAWWDSQDAHFRALGMRRIAGAWLSMWYSGGDYEVAPSQWMYDVAVHSDGYWLWFEQELTPDSWRAFAIGERRIRATEARVGKYLLKGKRDPHFVTPVEWSGSPELARKIKHISYHLGEEHLLHVNNVDADRPVELRLRFPCLPDGGRWRVTDPMSGLSHSIDGKTAVWDTGSLFNGIVLSLEKRSDLFLLISPQRGELSKVSRKDLIVSQEIRPMADHPETGPFTAISVAPAGAERLVYLGTKPLGYLGSHGGWALGNGIFSINSDGEDKKSLFGLKGYLWEPVWSPEGTRIAFTCYTNGRGQIFLVYADGSGLANLSRNTYCERSPTWSPDGGRIAFASDRDGDWEIYVMNADGSDQRRLTESAGTDERPVWSPDGKRIAFESHRGADLDVFVMNSDGSDQRAITKGMPGATETEWDTDLAVLVPDPDLGGPRSFTAGLPGLETDPAWSPDGKRIACTATGLNSRRRLLVADADGSKAHVVFRYGATLGPLSWSPDGKHLAVVHAGGVLVFNPDEFAGDHIGTVMEKAKKVVNSDLVKPYPGDGKSHMTWYSMGSASPRWVRRSFGGLSWSADGKRLAFSSNMDDGYFYVYILRIEGGEPKRLDETKSAWLQKISWCQK